MRLDGEQIVIETLTDGKVAADAAAVGMGDGLVEMYRHLHESDLPIAMGKYASSDVVTGLRDIAKLDMAVAGYLDRNVATVYLGFLGLSVEPEASSE